MSIFFHPFPKAKFHQTRNNCFSPARKVKERHNILLGTIGVFAQETDAFDRLTLLSWLLPAIVAAAALIDLLLILLYLYIFHPWRVIFQQVGSVKSTSGTGRQVNP